MNTDANCKLSGRRKYEVYGYRLRDKSVENSCIDLIDEPLFWYHSEYLPLQSVFNSVIWESIVKLFSIFFKSP